MGVHMSCVKYPSRCKRWLKVTSESVTLRHWSNLHVAKQHHIIYEATEGGVRYPISKGAITETEGGGLKAYSQ